jgi:hypothetical protein
VLFACTEVGTGVTTSTFVAFGNWELGRPLRSFNLSVLAASSANACLTRPSSDIIARATTLEAARSRCSLNASWIKVTSTYSMPLLPFSSKRGFAQAAARFSCVGQSQIRSSNFRCSSAVIFPAILLQVFIHVLSCRCFHLRSSVSRGSP